MTPATGRCACGAVRYVVRGPLREVWNCHCPRCRRISGHHLAATSAATSDVEVLDGAGDGGCALTWWAPDATVAYGFCSRCGSTLLWRSAAAPDRLALTAGTLDPPTGLRTTRAWWCAEASDYHRHPEGLELVAYEG